MKIYAPKEFEYAMWKDVDKYYIKVKSTKEVLEVTVEVFRALRNEARRIEREDISVPIYKKENNKVKVVGKSVLLSLNYETTNSNEDDWISDKGVHIKNLEKDYLIEDFKKTLTKSQLEVFEICMINGLSGVNYAKLKRVQPQSVHDVKIAIRKKFKKFI